MVWSSKQKQQEYDKKRYASKREYFIQNMKTWRMNNLQWFMHSSAKCRARKKGLEFNIDKEDIIIPELCPIMGFPLKSNTKLQKDSPTLDRIIPELGYVKGNIWVISALANTMKQNATKEELKKFATWINTL
jgi:hypothetical protein